MLLCVAGDSGAEFTRDRPRSGSRCSSQSFLIKSNAKQQVMVEERCSMTSSAVDVSTDHVAARAALSLHLRTNTKVSAKSQSCFKEPSVAYRSKVIVVSGGDSAFSAIPEKAETCSTTTTFKSNVVNGKRSTNTILVRYKPSKTVAEESDDDLQFEFYSRNDSASVNSSPPSTTSSESSSSKKDKTSTSAWAQIMELEGYRSPAIGLDNGPSKQSEKPSVSIESDSVSNASSLSGESFRSDLPVADPNSYLQKNTGGFYSNHHFNFASDGAWKSGDDPKCNSLSLTAANCSTDTVQISSDSSCCSTNRSLKEVMKSDHDMQAVPPNARSAVRCRYDNSVKSNSVHDSVGNCRQVKMSDKFKSPMLRSESSRVPKVQSQERNKSRRKTLPDGNISINSDKNPENKRDTAVKSQKSPEHDPNASWGRYNSRAMRDSVRKVAEKYAETVYQRRQTRLKLDSLPETKDAHSSAYASPFNEQDIDYSTKHSMHVKNTLYCTKRASSTSHLHELPRETETVLLNRNRLHIIMPTSTRHDHHNSHVPNATNRLYVPREVKECKLSQKHQSFDFRENMCGKTSVDLDSLSSNSDGKNTQTNETCAEKIAGIDSDMFRKNKNCPISNDVISTSNIQGQMIFTHASVYHPPPSPKAVTKFDTNISSIECKISSGEMKESAGLSLNMQDIKSKLCADCVLSAQYGPPSKQSACRAKHHVLDSPVVDIVRPSHSSMLKRSSLAAYDGDSSTSYLRLYQRKGDKNSDGAESGPRRCTMLTAREMTELVHGKCSGKSNDAKLSQAGVTSKVSNWIQKQKDKRKPVFFIGDAPSFFIDSSTETDHLDSGLKSNNRKSRRSLSLSSVREEVSSNSNGADSKVKLPWSRLKPTNSDENSLKHNEHKGLYIKRASSCCSNRGSARRPERQGSPVREERESATNPCCQNQVDDSNTLRNSRHHDQIKNSCHDSLPFNNAVDGSSLTSDFKSLKSNEIFYGTGVIAASKKTDSTLENSVQSFFDLGQSVKSLKAQNDDFFISSKVHVHSEQNDPVNEGTAFDSQGFRHSYSAVSSHSADTDRPDRSSLQKKLLNFKQITRALSLHSLKKKSKDLPTQASEPLKASNLETAPPVTYLSKWTRGSKKKIESLKYGSLRKSISYCELTARGAKVSGKLDTPVKLLPLAKSSVKRPPIKANIPPRTSACACSSSLRRSVSLYWQFPLSQRQEFSVEDPKHNILAKICFSRLHRRNTVLPFLREVKNSECKMITSERSCDQHLNGESGTLLDYEKSDPAVSRPSSLKHRRENTSVINELDPPESVLNRDKETSQESGIIMGLGSNHVLNEIDSCSNLNILEEYLPIDNSSDNTLMNEAPVSMNKSKAPIVLRLQNKSTSRSERFAKGKSASEIWGRSIRKSTDSSETKKRPSSQFYDIEEFDLKSEEQNLSQLSSIVSSSQPSLCATEQISNIPQPTGLISRHLPLHTSTPHLSPADSLLQRFRKSFAVRFKKKSEPSNPSKAESPKSSSRPLVPVSDSKILELSEEKQKSDDQNNCLPISVPGKNDSTSVNHVKKTSPNTHIKELTLSCNNNRKRNKRKTNWRASFFYDSVDSIFDPTIKSGVNKNRMPHFAGSDANILRKRAASTSDYSPKSKAIQRPISVVDCLTMENTDCSKVLDDKHDYSRTASDTTNGEDQQKNLTSLDQIWRANPVKLCRVHSRLLMCRHKGRYRLRRSISQPVELEMTGSIHNLRESTHGSADQESFQKGSLSSDDEASSESDIYHSYCCSPTRRSNTCWELSGDGTMYAEALWDHETLDSEELPFQAGDIIEVTDTSDQDWWWGTKDGQGGWFPSAFVRLYVSHRGPSLHFNGQQTDGIQIPYSPCKVSMNNLSCEQVRANIVQEIVATERDYVKHLKDVVEGYLKQVHRRPDMFSKERIETVFGNIKEIYHFQSQFLKQLEDCLDTDSPHLSQIGNCFLNHKEEFKMYSQYCNNHPLAVSELQELYCDSQYIHFFEACRLLQEMIDISLDGFLLTPIQRICKYPLQLAELLKFTDANHPDHVPVSNALAAMKEVAELVNERKRRMECLERIAEWQSSIEGWEGPDVLDTSSILIHCGEVTRVSSSWSRDIYLFIFDHQLIYCKKDLLKRHTYAYKGRLNLDHCDIVDVEDGKDSQFAVNVKNAWKIYCQDKEKWYLFYAKTSPEKDQWLRAFKTERQRVCDDEKQAFVVTEEAKRSARLAVHNKQKPKRPRAKFAKGRRCHPDVAVTELLLDSPSAKARSGSLPSNIHPELAIMAGAKLGPTRKKGSGWFHFGSGKKPKS